MSRFEAYYYDGQSSQQHKVSVYFLSSQQLRIVGDAVAVTWALNQVRCSPRVGNTRRHLYFPDGTQCETVDNDAVDALFSQPSLLHRLESHLPHVVAALLMTVALVWGGVTFGVPALAKQVAFHLPTETDHLLGKEALAELEQHWLQPSKLPAMRQAQITRLFQTLQQDIPAARQYQLVLRDSEHIGANALALPSGVIVVTDPLVKLAQSDDELLGVLAHEAGHLQQRHAVRQMLQNSATALTLIFLTGDIGSMTALAAGFPTVLVQSKYARDFEREADDFAFSYLRQHQRPTHALGDLLLRMEKREAEATSWWEYFSSHPATKERAERGKVSP